MLRINMLLSASTSIMTLPLYPRSRFNTNEINMINCITFMVFCQGGIFNFLRFFASFLEKMRIVLQVLDFQNANSSFGCIFRGKTHHMIHRHGKGDALPRGVQSHRSVKCL